MYRLPSSLRSGRDKVEKGVVPLCGALARWCRFANSFMFGISILTAFINNETNSLGHMLDPAN